MTTNRMLHRVHIRSIMVQHKCLKCQSSMSLSFPWKKCSVLTVQLIIAIVMSHFLAVLHSLIEQRLQCFRNFFAFFHWVAVMWWLLYVLGHLNTDMNVIMFQQCNTMQHIFNVVHFDNFFFCILVYCESIATMQKYADERITFC